MELLFIRFLKLPQLADMIRKTNICWFINPDIEQAGNGNNKRELHSLPNLFPTLEIFALDQSWAGSTSYWKYLSRHSSPTLLSNKSKNRSL